MESSALLALDGAKHRVDPAQAQRLKGLEADRLGDLEA